MTFRTTLLAALAAAFALAAGPARAHHGWSGYEEKARQLTGTIRAVDFGNPHSHIQLEVDGRTYRVILAPPSRMESRGLKKQDLAVGETATVEAYPHKTEKDELRAEWISVRGKRTELR